MAKKETNDAFRSSTAGKSSGRGDRDQPLHEQNASANEPIQHALKKQPEQIGAVFTLASIDGLLL
jgi:hypothetical protein